MERLGGWLPKAPCKLRLVGLTSLPGMQTREEWQAELWRRQQNIDPIGRIPNVALFQGTLIKGSIALNGVQRICALLFGSCSLILNALLIFGGVAGSRWPRTSAEIFSSIAVLPFCLVGLYFSLRIVINAIRNEPRKSRALNHRQRQSFLT